MISFCGIGQHGQLGNQMFQFAATVGVARKVDTTPAFPVENIRSNGHKRFRVPDCFELDRNFLKPRTEIRPDTVFKERQFHFNPQVFEVGDNTDLVGFYQSEKYFSAAEPEIRKNLVFKLAIVERAQMHLRGVSGTKVAVHVRRGDYVNNPAHGDLIGSNYYPTAMSSFDGMDCIFVVVSDDIAWCRRNFKHRQCMFLESGSDFVDLCLMSLCEHNIIANSTFSWWGAWLNQNPGKQVTAPKNWFGEKLRQHDHKDIYCDHWMQI
jgi:hypothetical protein